jgi:hypothetical protein
MKTTNIEGQHNLLASAAASAVVTAAVMPPSAAGTRSPPRPWRQRLTESRRLRRKWPTGLARHPSPQPPPLATWLPPKAGQQPIAPHPTLQHITGQRTSKKKLTNKIILDTNVRAEVGNTSPWRRQLPSFRGSARGRLGSARGGSLRARRRLAGSGDSRFRSRHRFATAGGSSSLRAPPRPLRLAHRIYEPDDRRKLLRSVLTVLVHHCRHNSSNISSVRKHLQVMSHARRKEVFASRAGHQNILGPSTPSNLQHPRRRLPELGRRHPSPEGCARPHQLHSKTIGDPQSPLQYLIFSS